MSPSRIVAPTFFPPISINYVLFISEIIALYETNLLLCTHNRIMQAVELTKISLGHRLTLPGVDRIAIKWICSVQKPLASNANKCQLKIC